jgi:hypothetical protein
VRIKLPNRHRLIKHPKEWQLGVDLSDRDPRPFEADADYT